MQSIKELFEQLPPDLQQEVTDFAEFLVDKKVRRKQKKLRMTWAGALREYRGQFTSIRASKESA